MKTKHGVIFFAALLLAAIGIVMASTSPARGVVSISFVGYTNASPAAQANSLPGPRRFAVFHVTNNSAYLLVTQSCSREINRGKAWATEAGVQFSGGLFLPRASGEMVIPTPAQESVWKASLVVRAESAVGLSKLRRRLIDGLALLGFRGPARHLYFPTWIVKTPEISG